MITFTETQAVMLRGLLSKEEERMRQEYSHLDFTPSGLKTVLVLQEKISGYIEILKRKSTKRRKLIGD